MSLINLEMFESLFKPKIERKHLNFVYQMYEDKLMDIQEDKENFRPENLTDEQKDAFEEIEKFQFELQYPYLHEHPDHEKLRKTLPAEELEVMEELVENYENFISSTKRLMKHYQKENNELRAELTESLLAYQMMINKWWKQKEYVSFQELIDARNTYAKKLNQFEMEGHFYNEDKEREERI